MTPDKKPKEPAFPAPLHIKEGCLVLLVPLGLMVLAVVAILTSIAINRYH